MNFRFSKCAIALSLALLATSPNFVQAEEVDGTLASTTEIEQASQTSEAAAVSSTETATKSSQTSSEEVTSEDQTTSTETAETTTATETFASAETTTETSTPASVVATSDETTTSPTTQHAQPRQRQQLLSKANLSMSVS